MLLTPHVLKSPKTGGFFLLIVLATQWVLLIRKLHSSVLGYFLPFFFGNFPPFVFSLFKIPNRNWTMSEISPLVFSFVSVLLFLFILEDFSDF